MQMSGKSTKRLDRLALNLVTSADSYGNGHRLKTNSPSRPGAILGFRWSKCNQKFEECHDLQRKNENKLYKNEMHKILIDIIMLQLSRAKPGNPASCIIKDILATSLRFSSKIGLRNHWCRLLEQTIFTMCTTACDAG